MCMFFVISSCVKAFFCETTTWPVARSSEEEKGSRQKWQASENHLASALIEYSNS